MEDWMEQVDLYNYLGVDPKASEHEIHYRYKQIARAVHPDRAQDTHLKEVAHESTTRVNYAKDVLLNAEKRKIYDRFGMKGLQMLTTHTEDDAGCEPLIERIQRATLEQLRADVYSVAQPSGSVRVEMSSVGFWNHYKRTRRLLPLYVQSAEANQSFSTHVNSTDSLTFSSTVWQRRDEMNPLARGGADVSVQWSRDQSDSVFLRAKAQYGSSGLLLNAHGVMPLDEEKDVLVHAEAEGTVFGTGSVDVALSRALSEQVRAHIGLKLSHTSQLRVGVRRKTNAISTAAEVFMTPNGSPTLALNWKRSSAKAFAQVNVSSPLNAALGLQLRSRIDADSLFSFGWRFSLSGIHWDIMYKRAHQRIEVPIHVSSSFEPSLVASALLVPTALFSAFHALYVKPRRDAQRKAQLDKVMESVQHSMDVQSLMRNEVMRLREREQQKNGLIIDSARLGWEVTCEQQIDDRDGSYLWIDVTIAVQHRLSYESDDDGVPQPRIIFSDVSSLPGVPGFADPHPGDHSELLVHYSFKGRRHRALFKEDERIIIPLQDHCVDDDSDEELHSDEVPDRDQVD